MRHLYQRIQAHVTEWREAGYPTDRYPALAEILDYATLPESDTRRFLRRAQLRALETYWYLRLVEGTPHIFDLYARYYPRPSERLAALGIDADAITTFVMDFGAEALWEKIRTDDAFVKAHNLDTVQETLTLDYPSYILALAMGAGKTILIGAIVATEFAMAMEYPGEDCPFIQNALVFAPGLTILESLRELAEVPYEKILPSRLHRPFEATYKLIFTREGEKDLPVICGSRYNLIVTNTEKIRIQKRSYRHYTWSDMYAAHMQEQYAADANLRLHAIASLPNLGVFSDEAHHTYGREIGKRLKRVRQTVNYLHRKTDLRCVINTTGTPYYERQPLRDVVFWYGLSQAIDDGILKSVENNIYAYDFDNRHADQFVASVVRDFFETYGEATLPDGVADVLARAKNTSVEALARAGLLESGAGKVRLLTWKELDPGWEPRAEHTPAVWKVTQHLIERLNTHGEEGAARLLAKLAPDTAAQARQLAYRLYGICERKGCADHARDYNALVVSWGAS
jgi:type III restriction enzyme